MWVKDGKPVGRVIEYGGYRIFNPTAEQYRSAGCEWVDPPEPPLPEPAPLRYSKYKIIRLLGEDWPVYKQQILDAGVYDMFQNAEYLEEGDVLFDAFMEKVPQELKEKLSECFWE